MAFVALQTQWHFAAGADRILRTGLVYASIPFVLDELRVPKPKRQALIADLRVMERAALAVYNEPKADDGG